MQAYKIQYCQHSHTVGDDLRLGDLQKGLICGAIQRLRALIVQQSCWGAFPAGKPAAGCLGSASESASPWTRSGEQANRTRSIFVQVLLWISTIRATEIDLRSRRSSVRKPSSRKLTNRNSTTASQATCQAAACRQQHITTYAASPLITASQI